MRRVKIIPLFFVSALATGTFSFAIFASQRETKYTPTFATYTNNDGDTYYNDITDDLIGNDLLKALQSLNSKKRKTTVGYDSMGTSPSGKFKYTDYDPDYVEYDSNNQPYGTRISSFYTYTSATSWNREHVWPNSHGGGKKGDVSSPYIDSDIHMPRPTISSENSDRGNSFFVEGMKSTSLGWDPYTAGYSESSRGEAARITFYCMVADSRLCIAPSNTSPSSGNDPVTGIAYGSGHTMGNLETIIKWNLNYSVTQREKNRNEGAEYLQGNRNAFIDHPEYVCRIWGNVNDKTRELCAGSIQTVAPTSVNLNKNTLELEEEKTEKLTYSFEPSNATNSFTWSSNNSAVATVTNGTVTAVKEGQATITITSNIDSNVSASCVATVKKSQTPVVPDPPTPPASIVSLSLDKESVELEIGESVSLTLSVNPEGASTEHVKWKIYNERVAVVNGNVITAVWAGETSLIVFNDPNNEDSDDWAPEVYAICNIKVKAKETPPPKTDDESDNKRSCGGNIAITSATLSALSLIYVILLTFKKKRDD